MMNIMHRLQTGRGALLGVALLLGASAVLQAAETAPTVANGAQFDAYLRRCFKPPSGSAGSEITLVFSIDHTGAIMGKPRISYSKLVGDVQTQKEFVASALAMLQNCTPVPVTREFGLMAANKVRASGWSPATGSRAVRSSQAMDWQKDDRC